MAAKEYIIQNANHNNMGRLNIVGCIFGRLTVIEFSGVKNQKTLWLCKCSCGKEIVAVGAMLKAGNTNSCGCFKIDGIVNRSLKHGHQRIGNKSAEYRAWRHMKSRCYNPNVERYDNYGGKGVIVCDRWINSFENFYLDMGQRPSPLHSVDRYPDVNGNYEPSNCRWATTEQQSRNTTKNHWLEYGGEKLVLSDWAIKLKTFPANINRMLKKKSFKEVVEYYKNKTC